MEFRVLFTGEYPNIQHPPFFKQIFSTPRIFGKIVFAAVVKALAKVPVSGGNAGEDKFDIIDKLTGEAYENAVAKMSNTERQAYAARA